MEWVVSILVLIFLIIVAIRAAFGARARYSKDVALSDVFDVNPSEPPADTGKPGEPIDPVVSEGLLRFFELAHTAPPLLHVLVTNDGAMKDEELIAALNEYLIRKKRRPMPEVAVRKVLILLVGTGFLVIAADEVRLSSSGRKLWKVLEGRGK